MNLTQSGQSFGAFTHICDMPIAVCSVWSALKVIISYSELL